MNAERNVFLRFRTSFLLIFLIPTLAWARSPSATLAFNEGVKLFNAKQFSEAIRQFDEAISFDDDFAEAHYARGACQYYLKSYDNALMDLNDALRLNPENEDARALRGAVEYESDRWDEALTDFSAVLKKNPHDAQSLIGRGVILLKRNDLVGATRDFRGFLSVRPDDPLAPRVREVLASLKEAPGEPTFEGQAAKSEPQTVHHETRSPTSDHLNHLADGLMNSPVVDSYSRKVLRGEGGQAVGDIRNHPEVPKGDQDDDTGGDVEIVEPK